MSRRVPELDALRALAAGVVLLFHLNPPRFFFGWTGVDLFFVLSGYLITSIILKNQGSRGFLRAFYVRRGLRIWPIYYLSFVVLIALAPLVPGDRRPPLEGWLYYLTYTQNVHLYRNRETPPFHLGFNHTWTLALEEQFYLLWPPLVALACWSGWECWGERLRRGFGRIGRWMRREKLGFLVDLWRGSAGVGPTAGRARGSLAGAVSGGDDGRVDGASWGVFSPVSAGGADLAGTVRRVRDGGGLAVLLLDRDRLDRHRAGFRWVFGLLFAGSAAWIGWGIAEQGGIGFMGLPTPSDPANVILVVNLFYLGLIGSVVLWSGHRVLRPLRFRPLVYLGLISYGIYLYHYMIYWWFGGFRFDYETSVVRGAEKIGLTLIVAMASWHLVEKPLLGLKERFRYSADRPGPAGPRPTPLAEGEPSVSQ